MDKKTREHVLVNHRVPFSWWDVFERYFILIAPISICVVALSMFYGGFKFGHIYQNHFLNKFFVTTVTCFAFGLWLTIFMIRRFESERQFKVINLPDNVNQSQIESIIHQLGWIIVSTDTNEIIAESKTSFFSWGELVTIVIDKNSLLINTRAQGRQPFTINKDNVNYKRILEKLS